MSNGAHHIQAGMYIVVNGQKYHGDVILHPVVDRQRVHVEDCQVRPAFTIQRNDNDTRTSMSKMIELGKELSKSYKQL